MIGALSYLVFSCAVSLWFIGTHCRTPAHLAKARQNPLWVWVCAGGVVIPATCIVARVYIWWRK